MFSPGLDRETRLVTYTALYLGAEETLGKLGDSLAYMRNKDDKVKLAQYGMLLLTLQVQYGRLTALFQLEDKTQHAVILLYRMTGKEKAQNCELVETINRLTLIKSDKLLRTVSVRVARSTLLLKFMQRENNNH